MIIGTLVPSGFLLDCHFFVICMIPESEVRSEDLSTKRVGTFGEEPSAHHDKLWLAQLSRRGWAWEFLRRSPGYRAAFQRQEASVADAAQWGLLKYEDPQRDAKDAVVFWRADDCPGVLPLVTVRDDEYAIPVSLDFGHLICRVDRHHHERGDKIDFLFSEADRFLQVSIKGAASLIKDAPLMMSALENPGNVTARAASFRRFNDLMQHGHLRQTLYPREPRAPRLINVLKALDGSLAGLPHRDIALQIFSKERVETDWGRKQHHLKDKVRRAVAYGQALMDGGYRQFLQPTYSRQIVRPVAPYG